jgi:hypothetical protein
MDEFQVVDEKEKRSTRRSYSPEEVDARKSSLSSGLDMHRVRARVCGGFLASWWYMGTSAKHLETWDSIARASQRRFLLLVL